MNAMVKTGSGGGMIPTNVAEAMDLARMMADCGMLPEQFRGKPGNALMVVEQAMRWGLSPFSVAMEVAFIQGKPFYSGKVMAGALNAAPGLLQGRLRYEYSGSGDDRTVKVIGILRGETEPREVPVQLKDARTQNKVWNTQPDQQLAYHGARVWGRRHAPEVMLGAWAPEEFEPEPERPEPREVQSTVTRPEPRQAPPKPTLTTAELDETLNGDNWDLDAPAPTPKPDRLRKVADRFRERMAEVQDQDGYNAVMGNTGVLAEWNKIRAERPELDEEMQVVATETLARITDAQAELST